jgi:hypothetical protein
MTVKELIELLKLHDQDLDVQLSVYGHSYNSNHQQCSHGGMGVAHRISGKYQCVVIGDGIHDFRSACTCGACNQYRREHDIEEKRDDLPDWARIGKCT